LRSLLVSAIFRILELRKLIFNIVVLWMCAWVIFRKKPLRLYEIDLTEIEQIELEEDDKEPPELQSWWRRYVI
jgi:hypothetical protein